MKNRISKKQKLAAIFGVFAVSAANASAALPTEYETALEAGATQLVGYAIAAGAIGIGIYVAMKTPRVIKKAANALMGG